MQKKIELLEEIIADLLLGYPTPTSLKVKRLQAEIASLPKEQSVTDEDINVIALALARQFYDMHNHQVIYLYGYIDGAKAMRDGLIKK